MSIYQLTDNLYIAPQLTPADAAEAGAARHRPRDLQPPRRRRAGQPDFAQVQQWLAAEGIDDVQHQPVVAPAIQAGDAGPL